MRTTAGILLALVISLSGIQTAKAQTIELLAGNTLNGAVNGTLLGGAAMALNNSSDFAPLRVGLGLGTLYGIGVGAYDISQSGGGQMIVTGTFNDGNNSSIIVLLDTFYGAAAGAVVASAVMLIANEPIVRGLQYGSSAGAVAGFSFGLIDSFMLSERITPATASASTSANGLLAINFDDKKSIGFLSPAVFTTIDAQPSKMSVKWNTAIELVNLKISL